MAARATTACAPVTVKVRLARRMRWRPEAERCKATFSMLRAVRCMLHAARCMLYVACRMPQHEMQHVTNCAAACCMLRCCTLHVACCAAAHCTLHIACQHSACCTLHRCVLHVAAVRQVRTERTASTPGASGRQRRRGSSSGARRTLKRSTQPATRFGWNAPRDARLAAHSNVPRTTRPARREAAWQLDGPPELACAIGRSRRSWPWARPGPTGVMNRSAGVASLLCLGLSTAAAC